MHTTRSPLVVTLVTTLSATWLTFVSSAGCTLLEDDDTSFDAAVEAAPLAPIDATAGGCQPNGAIGSVAFDYKPPVRMNVCTQEQVTALEASCFSTRSTDATCARWKAESGSCAACVYTPDTAAGWGAFVGRTAPAAASSVNWGGAFEVLHGASPGCAAAEQRFQECDYFACSTSESCTSSTSTQFQACREVATDTTCNAALQATQSACASPSDKAALDHDLKIFDVVRALCGPPPPPDGGTDADASDASRDADAGDAPADG